MHANSVCNPSSRAINSLEKHNPGMRPRFFNQKIEANDEEKNIPSTAANAIKRTGNDDDASSIQRIHHSALAATDGIVLIALNSDSCSCKFGIKDVMSSA